MMTDDEKIEKELKEFHDRMWLNWWNQFMCLAQNIENHDDDPMSFMRMAIEKYEALYGENNKEDLQ